MKKLLPIMFLSVLALVLAACGGQSAEQLNNDGNEAFENQDYEAALTAYHQAQDDSPELAEPHYNAANTHYRLEDYEQSQQEIEQALVNV
jgi:tetratricopeptide (TPR) repeat protein